MKIINLKLSLRTLYRNKLYTLLNMLGLSIGMASAMLILLWVQFQISFDRFHQNTDILYRVIQDQFYTNGEVFHVQVTPSGMSKLLKENIANITHSSRYNQTQFLIQVGETKMMENIQLVDGDFFTMFSFPLLKGDPKTVFNNVHAMVISEKMSKKYFGDKDPVGEIVMLEANYPFTVTGVIKDNPRNTEIHCDFLIPFEFYKELGVDVNQMNNNWITTYLQLTPGTAADSVNHSIETFKKKNFPDAEAVFFLQPLRNMHLYWIWGGGPIKNVKLFSMIAALIILIAAINFTNLSTAMAAKRFKEIGIKKSFGANRNLLIMQFLTETLVLSLISLFIALILTESVLPWYNSLLQTELRVNYHDWKLLGGFLVIMVVTGILSGAYPALYLSSFKPVKILKASGPSNSRSLLREALVVLQFGLAIVLIVNTIIIKKQRDYMLKKDLGIQKENILYLPVRGELKKNPEFFKTQLLKDPDVEIVCLSSHIPSAVWSNGGGYKWQGKPPEVDPLVSNTIVDYSFASTFEIDLLEGNFYPENSGLDTTHIVINKAFADIIGKEPIIGEVIEAWGKQREIIGVTENFHFKPLSTKIEPLVMYNLLPEYYNFMFCKISPDNMQKTIKRIEELHNSVNGSYPFEYHFMDAEYDNLYASEQRQGRIFNLFSFLAIFISCLGLFGLSSFMISQRIKEIGIRKANGADVLGIMLLFSRYYIRWVIVSFIIAAPVSYFIIHAWLKNYAFRTSISWWVFALAGLIALFIAFFTVSWQSWLAAKRNP
ncbi:MAG: ABC transporter permease, partial [Bacteroidales bacterium]|nr:ABC transporter permease [Bacteroidales bacterium]